MANVMVIDAGVPMVSNPCHISTIGPYYSMSSVTNVTEENPSISDNSTGNTDVFFCQKLCLVLCSQVDNALNLVELGISSGVKVCTS